MDVLSNLSCCFDASKDIGETSVELVVCNCAVSKRCCLKWETTTYIAALLFSTADFLADVFGYVSFVNIVSDPGPIQVYINAWLAFLIISGIIVISEIALPIFSSVRLAGCCDKQEKTEEELDAYR